MWSIYILWLMFRNICFINLTFWWDFCSAFSSAPIGTLFFFAVHILLHRSLCLAGNTYKNAELLNVALEKKIEIQCSQLGLPQVREQSGNLFQGQGKDRQFYCWRRGINYLKGVPMLHMQNYLKQKYIYPYYVFHIWLFFPLLLFSCVRVFFIYLFLPIEKKMSSNLFRCGHLV